MKYLYIILIMFNTIILSSQVTICPQLGVSYFPLTAFGANGFDKSNSLDLTFGISAQFPINKKFIFESRISYVGRSELYWTDNSFSYSTSTNIKHNDFNFDFFLLKKIVNNIDFGLGLSMTKKINSSIEIENSFNMGQVEILNYNNFDFGLNVNSKITISHVSFYLEYVRKISSERVNFIEIAGLNRLTVYIGVPISL